MPKRWAQFTLGLGLLVVVVVVASAFVDEPLRAYVEQKMNRSLKGYTCSYRRPGFSSDWSLCGSRGC